MFRILLLSIMSGLLLAMPARADNREDFVRSYVDRIVINSLDEPERHEPYFSETQLLNDFSRAFVDAYVEALKAAKRRGQVTLFDMDAMTGDPNRCPIGPVELVDRTRADTRNMIDVRFTTPACEGPARQHRLMFILVPADSSATRYQIDDVLRPRDNGGWFSLQAWLERQARAGDTD